MIQTKNLSGIQIMAIISLYDKCRYQKKSIMEIFNISKYTCDTIIDKNLIINKQHWQKAKDKLYPQFERCLTILDTSVEEMRYPYGQFDIVAKRAAIALHLYTGSGNQEMQLIMGLLHRDRAMFRYYESIKDQPHIRILSEKLILLDK